MVFIIITGGHINPAVSLAMAVIGKLSWWKVPLYYIAQTCGAFCGAAATYAVYYGNMFHLFIDNPVWFSLTCFYVDLKVVIIIINEYRYYKS